MSITFNVQDGARLANREFWGRIFGAAIQQNREKRGHSVAEAARLSGMDPSAWLAVEAGRVPKTAAQLRSMAGTLGFSNAQLGTLVCLCQNAWEA